MPPTKRGFVHSGASAIERIGDLITSRFSGVIIVEAVKRFMPFLWERGEAPDAPVQAGAPARARPL